MTSLPIRDPVADHLVTPENSALVLIDYQPTQFSSVRSMDPALLLKNIMRTVKTAKLFGLPIVHSTVNVSSGQNQPTVPEVAELLEASPPIDRTSINSWEDADFVAAVRATRRRKLIFCALWTEACMAFAALDALSERYEVYPVVDAIAGTSVEARRAAAGACDASRRQADQLGLARVRASARLGAPEDRSGVRSDRVYRTPVERAIWS